MTEWLFLVTPLAALALLLLFRFAGCSFDPPTNGGPTFGNPYQDEVGATILSDTGGCWRQPEPRPKTR